MQRDRPIGIGLPAAATGTTAATIRFCEQIGLLPAQECTTVNQRLSGAAQRRLNGVRHARDLGVPLEVTRAMLRLLDRSDQPCSAFDSIARGRLAEARLSLAPLKVLEADLEWTIGACSGGSLGERRLIEWLAGGR